MKSTVTASVMVALALFLSPQLPGSWAAGSARPEPPLPASLRTPSLNYILHESTGLESLESLIGCAVIEETSRVGEGKSKVHHMAVVNASTSKPGKHGKQSLPSAPVGSDGDGQQAQEPSGNPNALVDQEFIVKALDDAKAKWEARGGAPIVTASSESSGAIALRVLAYYFNIRFESSEAVSWRLETVDSISLPHTTPLDDEVFTKRVDNHFRGTYSYPRETSAVYIPRTVYRMRFVIVRTGGATVDAAVQKDGAEQPKGVNISGSEQYAYTREFIMFSPPSDALVQRDAGFFDGFKEMRDLRNSLQNPPSTPGVGGVKR